jgi:hypothetical protein
LGFAGWAYKGAALLDFLASGALAYDHDPVRGSAAPMYFDSVFKVRVTIACAGVGCHFHGN